MQPLNSIDARIDLQRLCFFPTYITPPTTMSSETKSATTQQPRSSHPLNQAPASRFHFMHPTIKTLPDFRIVFIAYLKEKSTAFSLVNESDRQALKTEYGDDISTQTSKLVVCGDDKYAWLFKVSEVLGGLKIKIRNVKLITERDVLEDYVLLDCEPDAIGRAQFMAKSSKDKEQKEEARPTQMILRAKTNEEE